MYGGDVKIFKFVFVFDWKYGIVVLFKIFGNFFGVGREVIMVLLVNLGSGFIYIGNLGVKIRYFEEVVVFEIFIWVMDDIFDFVNNKEGWVIINYFGGMFMDGVSEVRIRMLCELILSLLRMW